MRVVPGYDNRAFHCFGLAESGTLERARLAPLHFFQYVQLIFFFLGNKRTGSFTSAAERAVCS
jgi:hypothetical protein